MLLSPVLVPPGCCLRRTVTLGSVLSAVFVTALRPVDRWLALTVSSGLLYTITRLRLAPTAHVYPLCLRSAGERRDNCDAALGPPVHAAQVQQRRQWHRAARPRQDRSGVVVDFRLGLVLAAGAFLVLVVCIFAA